MKTRNGFVSNSSSSSFIVMVPLDKWTEWRAKWTKYEEEMLTRSWEQEKVGGVDFMVACGHSSSEDWGCDYEGKVPKKYQGVYSEDAMLALMKLPEGSYINSWSC